MLLVGAAACKALHIVYITGCTVQAQPAGRKLEAVVSSGVYYSARCNILMPMDIALNCGTRNESHSHRLDKIVQKIQEGNYAKALQKVRSVLKRRKRTRAELVDRVNADVGWWRCAATQMGVLRSSFHTVPHHIWQRAVEAMPGVPHTVDALGELQEACDTEAQKAARRVLVDLGDGIAMSFSGVDRSRFLEAVSGL